MEIANNIKKWVETLEQPETIIRNQWTFQGDFIEVRVDKHGEIEMIIERKKVNKSGFCTLILSEQTFLGDVQDITELPERIGQAINRFNKIYHR